MCAALRIFLLQIETAESLSGKRQQNVVVKRVHVSRGGKESPQIGPHWNMTAMAAESSEYIIAYEYRTNRTEAGSHMDYVDYRFRVHKGSEVFVVAVGITGIWHEPIPRLSRTLCELELSEIAREWLTEQLQRGYDPFRGPNRLDIPSETMESYVKQIQNEEY
jgi:hypothetical protein